MALPTWSLPHAAGSVRVGPSEEITWEPRSQRPARAATAAVTQVRREYAVSGIATYPTIGGVLALSAAIQVGPLHLLQRVLRQRLALRLHVDAVELGGVQAEDLRLVLLGQLLVAELVT